MFAGEEHPTGGAGPQGGVRTQGGGLQLLRQTGRETDREKIMSSTCKVINEVII